MIGGSACDVWWRVASSATLGTNTSLTGNILALASISLQTGASLDGRALAQTTAVTLDNNTFGGLTCLTTPSYITETVTPDSTTVTPKLPNTGYVANENTAVLWIIGISTGIITTAALIITSKKRAV